MNKKYILIDGMNTFFRAVHVSSRGISIEEKVAYALHVTLQSIAAVWRDHCSGGHIVFCLEGRSWRKDFYAPYKANRDVKRQAATVAEQEESKAFFEGYAKLVEFLQTRTNITILQHPRLEADDLIGGWIQCHPDDTHVIISSDSDFHQLLAENVTQFNGVAGELYKLNGIFNQKGRVIDKKTKLPKLIDDPQFILFEKCMRGDPTDNIFSAFPGVRKKGSAKKPGLIEAFADKDKKGYDWNSIMLTRWTDHNGVERKVIDDYKRNEVLVDLTKQPDDIRAIIKDTVTEKAVTRNVPMIGAHFLKFCGTYELTKLSEQASTYATLFSVPYQA